MTGLLVACIVLLSVVVIVLVVGLAVVSRRIGRAAGEMEETLRVMREEVLPLSGDLRQVLVNVDGLARSTREAVERVDRVAEAVGHLVEGRAAVGAASRAVESSRVTVVSLLEGIKQGLKTLRWARNESKEEPDDEQQ